MSGKLLAPCSLTKMFFTGESNSACSTWIDFSEPLATTICRYKLAFQQLQFTIFDGKPDNIVEIGRCFEKLEEEFDRLLKIDLKNTLTYTK